MTMSTAGEFSSLDHKSTTTTSRKFLNFQNLSEHEEQMLLIGNEDEKEACNRLKYDLANPLWS